MKNDELLIAYFRRYATKIARSAGGSPFSTANLVYHAGQSMVNTARIMLSAEPDHGAALVERLRLTVEECARAIDPNWVERPVAIDRQPDLCAEWR